MKDESGYMKKKSQSLYQQHELNIVRVSVRFSTNEGETWTDFKFSDREVYIYQLLTEPGEKSTIFTIFGSYADQRHSWLILQVNTSDVLGRSESEKKVQREGEDEELSSQQQQLTAAIIRLFQLFSTEG